MSLGALLLLAACGGKVESEPVPASAQDATNTPDAGDESCPPPYGWEAVSANDGAIVDAWWISSPDGARYVGCWDADPYALPDR